MVKRCKQSVIEIWTREYINCVDARQPEDKNADIIQIERGSAIDGYIVEVLRHEKSCLEGGLIL